MAPAPGVLHIHVLRGSKLRNTSILGKLDPYIRVAFGGNESESEEFHNAGSECNFDFTLELPFDETKFGFELMFEVRRTRHFKNDETVGKVIVPLKDVIAAKEKHNAFEGTLDLSVTGQPGGKFTGYLNVVYWWEVTAPSYVFSIPKKRLDTKHTTSSGALRTLVDGTKFRPFLSYRLRLFMVNEIFNEETCGWNRDYPAAQKIFGDNAQGKAIREVLKQEHSLLYHEEDKFCKPDQIHLLYDLRDFVDNILSKFANSASEGMSVRWTYVILPTSCMYFSITSKNTAQDFLSKHALHANASSSVVYAGEFFLDTKSKRYEETGKPAFIIDNNSGTFGPTKEKLPKLKALLEANFGTELPIMTLDRDDPLLKELFNVNNVE